MSEPSVAAAGPARRPAKLRRSARAVGRLLGEAGKRVYAAILIGIVLGLTFMALRYLVRSLILPAPPPPQIVDIPRWMNAVMLERGRGSFAGVAATANPRTPPTHYHNLGPPFEPDRVNGCTRGGCHFPLPHGRQKTDRAFLNMHATSIHCGVCHMQTEQQPLPLVWYDLESGAAQDTPAMLKAYGWLIAPAAQTPGSLTAADQRAIVRLLRQAAERAGGDAVIERLAFDLDAVSVHSDEFARLLEVAREELPRHFRGEYGAKLALTDEHGQPRLQPPGNEDAVQEFLKHGDELSAEQRQALLTRIHPARRHPTLRCTQCHTPQGSLVDLAKVGYPTARIEALVRPLVMQAIEHIVEGREFYMPRFLPASEEPQTRPQQP